MTVGWPRSRKQHKAVPGSRCLLPHTAAGNRNGRDTTSRVRGIARGQAVVGVVARLVLDGAAAWARKDHLPTRAGIFAAPQRGIPGVNQTRIRRVESKNADAAAKIEHPPRLATVARDVTARHVAVLDNHAGVEWTDGRSDGSPAAAGPMIFQALVAGACANPVNVTNEKRIAKPNIRLIKSLGSARALSLS